MITEANMARAYRCPVCKKPLTRKEFERAFKIHEAQKEHVEARERQLTERERRFKEKERKIKQQAREAERKRTHRIVQGKDLQIGKLRETIRALKLGKTEQEFGPEFEGKLVKRLRNEFTGDDVQPTKGSRGDDVLHIVKDGSKVMGVIIYECKWTLRISRSHVQRAARAKMARNAQFAVLVTCGTRRGFSGLDTEFGVTIVAPAGVLALAGLLRNHLVEMFRAGVEKRRRTQIANRLLRFVKSSEFKNRIEEVVRTADRLREGIREEFRWHKNDWERRWHEYGRIRWDGFAIQENLRRVFQGEAPKQLIQPKERLALPASNSTRLEGLEGGLLLLELCSTIITLCARVHRAVRVLQVPHA
jgi:uncharacterized Zn finger protein (UPF0148 family)